MYLINIIIKAELVPNNQASELLEAHREWFNTHAKAGYFLLVGPYRDQSMAGVIIAQANNQSELDAIIAKDAYYPDLASYDIHEFQANIISENITHYKGK